MAQPPEVEGLSAELRAAYERAGRNIRAQLDSIRDDPARWRQRERLQALAREVQQAMSDLDRGTSAWLGHTFPDIYAMGAQVTAQRLVLPFSWEQSDRQAVATLAADMQTDLLAATRRTTSRTKRLVRELSRTKLLDAVVEGKTPEVAGRDLARALQRLDVYGVQYKDGTRVGIESYAPMVIRTKTAVAYNAGTLNFGRDNGVEWYEVFDSPDCGWDGHDDFDKPNGTVRSADECENNVISHPNCVRALGPRPDIKTADEAASAEATPGGDTVSL